MQAPFEMTDGLSKLKKIIDDFPLTSPHWNEAQNRFQFIDRLLTECLGWERPHITVEEPDGAGGRADYILGYPPKAVLEAKREAKTFGSLPTGKPSTIRKLQPLLNNSKDLNDAVVQVLQYCVMNGSPIAIVCNGPQLILLQALTPGYSPLQGECYCFDGIEDYINYFPVLWTILSPEGITENRASRDLSYHRNPRIPSKASEFIPEPNKYRYRNNFQENLRELSYLLLEEIEDNPTIKSSFYDECYVPLEANNRHLLLSKKIIESRYRRVGGDGISPSALDEVASTNKDGDLLINEAIAWEASSSRPIVVIGDVGVGKTSFFENLYEKMEQSEKSNTYFIHVNLGVKANLSDDVKSYVLDEIPNVLKTSYNIDIHSSDFANAVYYEELETFDRGVKGALKTIDPDAYSKARIEYLNDLIHKRGNHLHAAIGHLSKGQGKQIILIMDT